MYSTLYSTCSKKKGKKERKLFLCIGLNQESLRILRILMYKKIQNNNTRSIIILTTLKLEKSIRSEPRIMRNFCQPEEKIKLIKAKNKL